MTEDIEEIMNELSFDIICGLTADMSIENMVEFREVFNKEDK